MFRIRLIILAGLIISVTLGIVYKAPTVNDASTENIITWVATDLGPLALLGAALSHTLEIFEFWGNIRSRQEKKLIVFLLCSIIITVEMYLSKTASLIYQLSPVVNYTVSFVTIWVATQETYGAIKKNGLRLQDKPRP